MDVERKQVEPPTLVSAAPRTAQLLSVKQVATLLQCSVRTVYRLADRGAMLRPVKLGGLVRWRAAELETWIDSGCPSCRTRV